MQDNKKIIGMRINTALAKRNKSQKELAEYLNVKPNVISYFCSSSRTPNTEQIIMIAKFLNVSADYLLGLSESEFIDDKKKNAANTTGLTDEAITELIRLKEENRATAYSDILSLLIEFANTEYVLALIGAKISYFANKKILKDNELVKDMINRTMYIDIDDLRICVYKDNLIESILQTEFINSLNTICNEYIMRYSITPVNRKKEYDDFKKKLSERVKKKEINLEEFSKMIEEYLDRGTENGKYNPSKE